MNATLVLASQCPDLACAVGSLIAAGEVDILNCDEFCQAVKELLKANQCSDSLANSSSPQMGTLSVYQNPENDFKSHKLLTHCSALEPEQILALSSELSSLDLLPMMAEIAEKQAEEIKRQVLQC